MLTETQDARVTTQCPEVRANGDRCQFFEHHQGDHFFGSDGVRRRDAMLTPDEQIAALARQVTGLLEQRARAWEALELALEWTAKGGFRAAAFRDGVEGSLTCEWDSRDGQLAYAAGMRVAAVLREARGEKGGAE